MVREEKAADIDKICRDILRMSMGLGEDEKEVLKDKLERTVANIDKPAHIRVSIIHNYNRVNGFTD